MALFDITFSPKESDSLCKPYDAEFSLKSWEADGQEINFLYVSNIKIVYYVKKN
jgi:hypothetical protein